MNCNKLSPTTLAAIYARIPEFKNWIKDVETHVMTEALDGRTLPGYKLVEGRSARRWIDDDATARAMLAMGHKPEVVFNRKIIGIGAAEQLLGRDHRVLSEHTIKLPGAPVLVPVSDPRSTVARTPAGDEFQS